MTTSTARIYNIDVDKIDGGDSFRSSIYNMFDSSASLMSPENKMLAIAQELIQQNDANQIQNIDNGSNNKSVKDLMNDACTAKSKVCDESDFEKELFSGFDPHNVLRPIDDEENLTKELIMCKMNLRQYLHDNNITDVRYKIVSFIDVQRVTNLTLVFLVSSK